MIIKKNLGENGDTRDIAQHNKGNIQKTQSQYRVKQAATQSISVKIRNETRISPLTAPTQHRPEVLASQ